MKKNIQSSFKTKRKNSTHGFTTTNQVPSTHQRSGSNSNATAPNKQQLMRTDIYKGDVLTVNAATAAIMKTLTFFKELLLRIKTCIVPFTLEAPSLLSVQRFSKTQPVCLQVAVTLMASIPAIISQFSFLFSFLLPSSTEAHQNLILITVLAHWTFAHG